ncbi:UTRA domain-containing protein [Actinokineospora auranticolor]|uniref:GntR family transcriptional regulator n=1 Tax=Actinokineospora auranticolor TaxID=155976 RepID=A0A2S6GRY2_9PSEU|nr:UTRA domain-containing protein [Actinokineospora auranticolor]PPK67959.1 GntR family transcriptional regulator [Actinokineospora auranticolor]
MTDRDFQPYRRVSPSRLRDRARSVWAADDPDRPPVVSDLVVAEEVPPPRVAEALGLDADALALVRRRVYLVEERPIQLAWTYYPAELVRESAIAEPETGPGGAYARLAELGSAPVRFREELRSRMPSHEEREVLRLGQAVPVIHVTRTAYQADDAAVEVNEMVLDAAAYVLEYHF